ncbi:MAG TPA: aldehyde dehydrogenase family protein, partial [Planctomycetota bacterium]|nr:aldehyde dehydrogenase family protein [Planctomycetota bacterium]
SLELGGKNAMIVMEDADLDLALEGALGGGFGTTGQRCTATSRLILHEAIAPEFVERLARRARALRVGNGLETKTEMGPLVNANALRKVEEYVEIGKAEGAKLVCGGERAHPDGYKDGAFFQPTLFKGVKRDMRIAREEIFGPVVSCLEVKDLDDAIETLNDSRYGLSSSIYTKDGPRAFRAMRDIEAGITYVNGPTIGAEVHLPFGGVKETGNGHREAGPQVYDVFSEWKAIYVDYSGKLQKAQIDNRQEGA